MTDLQLLESYVQCGAQEAFAQLVSRHANWIYSLALRRVHGDAHLAEDVTQAVFLLLAQKARKAAAAKSLNSWLFKVAQYSSATALRAKARREHHERQAAAMSSEIRDEQADAEAIWRQVAPRLDELVERLPSADREALLLRFYQRKSMAEVGAGLGVSEDAAKKRVARAIERLRDLLGRAGVVASVGSLAAPLLTHTTSQMAPATLVASCSAQVGSAGAAAIAIAKGAIEMIIRAQIKVAVLYSILAAVILPVGISGIRLATTALAQSRAQSPKPQLDQREIERRRQLCATNLNALFKELLSYSQDHLGRFPPDLGALVVEDYGRRIDIFVCPNVGKPLPGRLARAELGDWINANTDYVYLGAGVSNISDKSVFVYDKETNDPDGGVNLLYRDGHVAFLKPDAAREAIAGSLLTVRKERCRGNLWSIGRAIADFADDHDGAFPADLGTLLVTAQHEPNDEKYRGLMYHTARKGLSKFLCPNFETALPADWETMAREQQVAWINKTTDYIYVGIGLSKATAGSATVIAYEKNDSEHENGMYILFGDGHVELVPAEVARSTVAKSAKDRGL